MSNIFTNNANPGNLGTGNPPTPQNPSKNGALPQNDNGTPTGVISDNATKNILEHLEIPRQEAPERPKFTGYDEAYQKEPDQEATDEDFEITDEDLGGEESEFDEIPEYMTDMAIDFAVDQTDLYLPKLIAWLNELEDLEEFRASKPEIENIKKYAKIVAKEHGGIKLTPQNQLLLALGMAYGFPLFKGILKQSPKLLKYMANGFKREAKKTDPNNEPAEMPQYDTCLHPDCGETFLKGTGFPKNTQFTELKGKFCGSSHFTTYTNNKGLTGTKGKTRKTTTNE